MHLFAIIVSMRNLLVWNVELSYGIPTESIGIPVVYKHTQSNVSKTKYTRTQHREGFVCISSDSFQFVCHFRNNFRKLGESEEKSSYMCHYYRSIHTFKCLFGIHYKVFNLLLAWLPFSASSLLRFSNNHMNIFYMFACQYTSNVNQNGALKTVYILNVECNKKLMPLLFLSRSGNFAVVFPLLLSFSYSVI